MLKQEALKQIKEIILRDYGVLMSDEQAQQMGVSLLRLTRLSISFSDQQFKNKEKNIKPWGEPCAGLVKIK